jgi:hypothetical protein
VLKTDEVAVLFQSNHFHTCYKCPGSGRIYTLVTDSGLITAAPNIVWAQLNDIRGDVQYCDDFFRAYDHHRPVKPPPVGTVPIQNAHPLAPPAYPAAAPAAGGGPVYGDGGGGGGGAYHGGRHPPGYAPVPRAPPGAPAPAARDSDCSIQ